MVRHGHLTRDPLLTVNAIHNVTFLLIGVVKVVEGFCYWRVHPFVAHLLQGTLFRTGRILK